MESLIFLVLIVWALKTAIVDAPYTLRGQTPPRHRLAMQRLALKQTKAAGAGQRASGSGAARDYGRVVWQHAWSDLTDRHNQRRARRLARPARRARPGPARAYFRGLTADVRESLWRRWDKAWQAADARRRGDDPIVTEQPAGSPVGDSTPASDEAAAETRTASPAGVDAAKPVRPRVAEELPAAYLGDGITTESTNHREATRMFQMLNLGEVTGLQSAIDFADKLAKASEESVNHLELLGGGLSEGGTGTETVGRFSSAGDSLSAAASQLREAANELRRHLTVRESYEATGNQAGDKDFVLAE